MSALLKFEVSAVWIECSSCHVSFAITSGHQEQLRSGRTTFYCPNGHTQWYPGKTEAEKIEAAKALVRKEMQLEIDAAHRSLEWSRAQAAKDAKAAKKAREELRLLTTRVEAGVCIHCNRTFQQLARHMKYKHAEELKTK